MKPELRAVSTELPDPPYPEDTKANGYRPEFDIRRIKASRTWRLAGADTRNALLRLWLECWENIPVGTWPDDSEVIAISIDVSVDWFEGHRKRLMSGWVMHSDGNLYHPYITEMVLGMLGKRRSSAERKARSRAKNNGNVTGMSRVTSCESHGSHAQEQEQEQEQETITNTRSSGDELDGFEQFWGRYPRKVGKAKARKAWTSKKCGKLNGKVLSGLDDYIKLEWRDRPKDKIPYPATWLNGECWTDELESTSTKTGPRTV